MNDPTLWLPEIPERPDYYSTADFYQSAVDEMHRADELARADYDETEGDFYEF